LKFAKEWAGSRRGEDDFFDALRVFPDAWNSDVHRKAELARRADLVRVGTAPGTPYAKAKTRAKKGAKALRVPGNPFPVPDQSPSPTVLATGVLAKKRNEGHHLAEALTQERRDLALLLQEASPSPPIKEALELWQKAAWEVQSQALQLRADGCWYITHPTALKGALRLAAPAATALLKTVGQAAAALIRWAKQGKGTGSTTPPPAKTEQGEGNGGAAHSDAETPPPGADQFIFAPEGDGYYVAGFGESGHVTRLKGFDIIAQLVRTPSQTVTMLELTGAAADERIGADQRSRQEALDLRALREIRDRLAERREDYENAKAENNTVERDLAEKEIEELKSNLQKATGLAGRSRDMNSQIDRLRPTIHGNLNTAYKRLRSATPPMVQLADHFEQTISSEGGAFIYSPASPIAWSSTVPDKK
jgi:hypothetical protein